MSAAIDRSHTDLRHRDAQSTEAQIEAAWRSAHATVVRECDETLVATSGEVPRALSGTYYRNGPGRLERGGVAYGHLFDGDGMVAALTFDRGRVRFSNRFVRTAAFEDEERHGQILHRGFGTDRPGGFLQNALRMRFKNAANTAIVHHAGRMLALWEGGVPHAIDPRTLATLGEEDFGGRLRASRSLEAMLLGRGLPFCAHPKIDPRSGELIAFGVRHGVRPRLLIHRVDRDGVMSPSRTIDLPELCFVHDFALTERHLVFFLAPVVFRIGHALLGLATPAESLTTRARPAQVLVVPRDGRAPRWLEGPAGFVFHVAHAFDDDEHVIVADVVRYPRFPKLGAPLDPAATLRSLPTPSLVRVRIDLRRGRVASEAESGLAAELPTVSPSVGLGRHRFVYAIASGLRHDGRFLTSIARFDRAHARTHRIDFAPDLPSEPCVVPRAPNAAEEDAWLITTVYDGERRQSDFVVLDARTLTVVARGPLPTHLAPGFHGHWVPALDTSRAAT